MNQEVQKLVNDTWYIERGSYGDFTSYFNFFVEVVMVTIMENEHIKCGPMLTRISAYSRMI